MYRGTLKREGKERHKRELQHQLFTIDNLKWQVQA
jgi:hypothetical protein